MMAMKGYSTFPKALALLEPHNQIVLCHIQNNRLEWGSYPSAEKQSVYSTTPANWVMHSFISNNSEHSLCQNSSI